jgi:hypothetical protein
MAETASRSDDIVQLQVFGGPLSLFIWLCWKSKIYLVFRPAVCGLQVKRNLEPREMMIEVSKSKSRGKWELREIDVSLNQFKLYSLSFHRYHHLLDIPSVLIQDVKTQTKGEGI